MFSCVKHFETGNNKGNNKRGGTTMKDMQAQLLLELRQTQAEIENSLSNNQNQAWFTTILEEELADIKVAMKKINNGSFGQCEISGELLSADLLKIIPTLKSVKDTETLDTFFRKSLNSPFY
jgi:RNA polymerase-binding transcription factor DksA